MASSSATLADIEERFFWCSFCYEPFKDPKLLPCLHKYCRPCLNRIITADAKGTFHCPLCQQEHTKPKEGVDGFKSDFHSKSVVEFLQLEMSFKHDDVKRCHGCKELKKVVSYCFKCKNFLCDECYDFHLNNEMVAEHRPHTIKLKNVDLKGLTLEKLGSLTEDPRCTTHVKNSAQLCCETCGSLPICVACTYGDHQGHAIHDVKKLARCERERLGAVLTVLDKYKAQLYELPQKVENGRRKLRTIVTEKKQKAENHYRRASEKISKMVEDNNNKLEQCKKEIEAIRLKECNQVKQEREREIKKVKQRYDRILKEREAKYDKESEQVEIKHGQIDDRLSAKIDKLKKELQRYKDKIEASHARNERGFQRIADHSEHTTNRYENFTATSSAVLASKNDWTDARCLPDITAASEPLIRDVKKEFQELDSLSDIKMGNLSLISIVNNVLITETEESVMNIGQLNGDIRSISSSRFGHIVLSGWVSSGNKSHITVVNRKGQVLRQVQMEKAAGSIYCANRYCDSLSGSLIATACSSNQAGIFDVSNGKYVKKDIKDMSISWPGWVTCVTTDTENRIYVAGSHGDILVFNDELKYQCTLRLPHISNLYDMDVHEDRLLICGGHNAYAITVKGREPNLVHQFAKPGPEGGNWSPRSVCTDSNQYIYMLWRSGSGCALLTQYSQDGSRIPVTTRKIDSDAWCLSTLTTENDEKLLVATHDTAKLYIYGLVTSSILN